MTQKYTAQGIRREETEGEEPQVFGRGMGRMQNKIMTDSI